MHLGIPQIRRPLTAGLAALVIAALSHCSWEDGRELARRIVATGDLELAAATPIQQPAHDCTHESGCICRGATLAQPVNALHCKPASNGLLLVDALSTDGCNLTVTALLGTLTTHFFARPRSGRQLRALLASLVI